MRGQDPPEAHKITPAQEIRRQNMKNKMITAVLAMSMVLGAGAASYAKRQIRILHQYRRTGTERDRPQSSAMRRRCRTSRCSAKKKPDLENICKENFDFASVCQIKTDCKDQNTNQDQNAGNTQNKTIRQTRTIKKIKTTEMTAVRDEPVAPDGAT